MANDDILFYQRAINEKCSKIVFNELFHFSPALARLKYERVAALRAS